MNSTEAWNEEFVNVMCAVFVAKPASEPVKKAIKSEAQRIMRLCLLKNVKISPSPQHERIFSILCAIAVSQPNVWETVLERLSIRKSNVWRIPNVGEVNVSDVKKFISVAVAALKLTVAIKNGKNETEKAELLNDRSRVDLSTAADVISAAEAEESVYANSDKMPIASSLSRRCRQKQSRVVEECDEVVDVDYTDERQGGVTFFQHCDWTEIAARVDAVHKSKPFWRCGGMPAPETRDNVEECILRNSLMSRVSDNGLLCPVLFSPHLTRTLLGSRHRIATRDVEGNDEPPQGLMRCIVCDSQRKQGSFASLHHHHNDHAVHEDSGDKAEQLRCEKLFPPISLNDGILECVVCRQWVHHECIFPPQRDIAFPFRCHRCRVEKPLLRKRSRLEVPGRLEDGKSDEELRQQYIEELVEAVDPWSRVRSSMQIVTHVQR